MAPNAKKKAYDYIKKMLLDDSVSGEVNLSEISIAEAIGVSRTPVREAMGLLESEGLVEIIPNKGPVRVKLDFNDIMMITQILEGLEGIATRVACERANRHELEALRQELLSITDLNDPEQREQSQQCGYKIHSAIMQATENKRMIKIVDNMLLQRRRIGRLGVYNSENAQKRCQQHLAILDAILEKNPDKAEAAMRQHVIDVSMDAANTLYKSYFY